MRCMDGKVRQGVARRIEQMERELLFLTKKEDKRLLMVRLKGWTDNDLHVVFFLNSIYQQVIGPQQAAARGGPLGLGTDISVAHGSTKYDSDSAVRVVAAVRGFEEMVEGLGLRKRWLHANTCREVIDAIAGGDDGDLPPIDVLSPIIR